MNTTNLITDYLISGVLGILAFFLPYYMVNPEILKGFFSTEIKKETVISIGVILITYSFGVVYNQISDKIEDIYFKLFCITVVEDSEAALQQRLGFDHHYALQLVVAKSESGYDFISFRRTMIRVVRAILTFSILVPLLHMVISLFIYIVYHHLSFSVCNLIVISVCLVLTITATTILIKLYKGYYSAITNFALILGDGEENPQ